MSITYCPQNILVIAAHQDDETIGCGGSIKKWTSMGSIVKVVFVTDGSTGVDKTEEYKQNIINQRKEESKIVKNILGISEISYLDYECQNVPNDKEIFHKFISLIRGFKPRLILTHSLSDKHRDHQMVSKIVQEATWKAQEDIHKKLGDIHKVDDLWAFEITDLHPKVDFVVDISGYFIHKKESINAYVSQDKVVKGICKHIEGLAMVRGYMAGVEYGEAFVRLSKLPIII